MLEIALLCAAQGGPTALASTSADTRLLQDSVVWDEDWIRREEGTLASKVYLPRHAQIAWLGDWLQNGSLEAPGDVDALAWWPTGESPGPVPRDFVFSLVSNQGGFLDGDVLRFAAGRGLEVVVPEDEFLSLLQPASGSFDLDALSHRRPDEIWFSVNANLTGTVLGDIQDGDVLVYDRTQNNIRREYTEADMQAFVDQATGGSSSINDVMSLSFYSPTDEMVFSVQSPSAQDGTVFGTGQGGRLLPGFEESDWEFQEASELDALAFASLYFPQPPVFETALVEVGQSAVVRLYVKHAQPISTVDGYVASRVQYNLQPGQGIGFAFLDPNDPWLTRLTHAGHTHPRVTDSSGSAAFDWVTPILPANMAYLDLNLQAYDELGGAWSTPLILRIR